MIILTSRQKARIKELVKSAMGHSKKAEDMEKEVKARMDAVNTPLKCELCGSHFTEGYLAAKPDCLFGWMCAKCYNEVYMKDEIFDAPICSHGKDRRTCMTAIAGYCCDKEKKE